MTRDFVADLSAMTNTHLPVRDNIGAALRFVRENWRFVLSVAGIGAVAHLLALMGLGALPLVWLLALAVITSAVHAALTRAALSGAAAVAPNILRDASRVAASGAIVGFFFVIVAFLITYVAMSILIAPFADEAKAAVNDQAALTALMQRAVSEQPAVVFGSALAGFIILLLLTSRLYVSAPASVEQGRIVVFASWRLTKGHMLRIAAARLALLAPALIFAGALQSLIGMAVGVGSGDPFAMAASAQSNPYGFLAFFAGAQFIQITIYSALEAGLSTYLYRSLKPQEQAPAA